MPMTEQDWQKAVSSLFDIVTYHRTIVMQADEGHPVDPVELLVKLSAGMECLASIALRVIENGVRGDEAAPPT